MLEMTFASKLKQAMDESGLKQVDLVRMRNALIDPRGFGGEDVRIADEQLSVIARFSNGDARGALSTLEMVVINSPADVDGSVTVDQATLEQCVSRKALLYDKHGEEHYNIISALHKSMFRTVVATSGRAVSSAFSLQLRLWGLVQSTSSLEYACTGSI